jgi:hypothetical protein
MITVEQAYALGPDGRVDMDLFQRFIDQQNVNKANVGPNSALAASLTPEQKYMQANPDVLNQISAMQNDPSLGQRSDEEKNVFAAEQARQHFIDYGQAEGRDSFGMPLSGFTTGQQPANTMPVQTQPFNPVVVQPDSNQSTGGTGTNTAPNVMPAPMNLNAPLPGQLPGYDFVGDVNRYANSIGNFGGLLQNTNPFYAGQVPGPATQAMPQTGGYNAPELSMYPNANYAAGAFPIIFTS